MAEKSYIGFKAAPAIDWGKLTSEFSQGLMEIGARRGIQNAYFDELQRNNMSAVRETENFQTQDLNTLLSGAISQNVNNTYEINKGVKAGNINHNDYRNFINNSNDDWKSFATTAKTLDQTIQNGLARQQPGDDGLPAGSKYEEDLIERRSELLNLKNKTMYQDPNTGKFFLADLDETGNISDYNNLHDVKSLNKPMNVNDNFFNFNGLIKNRTENIGVYEEAFVEDIETVDGRIRKNIYMTEKGAVMNPGVPDAISRVQSYIKSNPRLTYNTLAQSDNRYETYFDPKDQQGGDYQKKMNKFIEIENGSRRIRGEEPLEGEELGGFIAEYDRFLVPNITDAQGIFQPSLNQEQMMALDAVVESAFMSNLGYSKVEAKPPKPKASKTSTSKEEEGKVNYDLYETLYDAIKEGDSETLNIRKTPEAKDLRFEVRQDGFIDVYDISENTVGDPKNKLVFERKSLTDLVPYFYGKSGATGGTKPEATYNAERDAFYKATGKPEIAMMEEQTEEMPADQMASNQGGNFLQRLANGILGRGNNQNIS